MVDPSKMSVADARTLLSFWFERQERGVRAFCFKAWYDKKEEGIVTAMSVNNQSKPSGKATRESRRPRTQKRSLAKARNERSSDEEAGQDSENALDTDIGRHGDDDVDLLNHGSTARTSDREPMRNRGEIQTRSKRNTARTPKEGNDTEESTAMNMKFGPPRGQPRNDTAGQQGGERKKRKADGVNTAETGQSSEGRTAKKRKVDSSKNQGGTTAQAVKTPMKKRGKGGPKAIPAASKPMATRSTGLKNKSTQG